MRCLACGGQAEMARPSKSWECLECAFWWWEDDGSWEMNLSYGMRQGGKRRNLIEVPEGCLAVFGEVL